MLTDKDLICGIIDRLNSEFNAEITIEWGVELHDLIVNGKTKTIGYTSEILYWLEGYECAARRQAAQNATQFIDTFNL